MRLTTLSLVLLASVSVAACSHTWTPPDITYDAAATPQPAVLEAEPPKAVEIVEIPTPLPLPGQLQRIPEARPQAPEPADPRARVEAANSAARIQPSRSGYFNAVQVYPYADGALATTERWTAILTIAVQTPRDAERLRKNPLGIYVHALNWSKELG